MEKVDHDWMSTDSRESIFVVTRVLVVFQVIVGSVRNGADAMVEWFLYFPLGWMGEL